MMLNIFFEVKNSQFRPIKNVLIGKFKHQVIVVGADWF